MDQLFYSTGKGSVWMDPAFWMGFFGFLSSLVVAAAAHLKNVQQDKAALKRDGRINTLEVEVKHCHEEREVLREEVRRVRDKLQ